MDERSTLDHATYFATGEGMGAIGDCTAAALNNALGYYAAALAAAESAHKHSQQLGIAPLVLPELIEAASRCGQLARASEALEELVETTQACASDWAVGLRARSRALMSEGSVAEACYLEAIERLGRTDLGTELGRAYLLYGEWLRRENRRFDARVQLRSALEIFTAVGAEALRERVARELLATGETVRGRRDDTRYELTPQEAQIARLAGAGHTNAEIGTELFISARTVEWHLRKVYTKLGVGSRRQLRRVPVAQWVGGMAIAS